jgi:hypothetical protein
MNEIDTSLDRLADDAVEAGQTPQDSDASAQPPADAKTRKAEAKARAKARAKRQKERDKAAKKGGDTSEAAAPTPEAATAAKPDKTSGGFKLKKLFGSDKSKGKDAAATPVAAKGGEDTPSSPTPLDEMIFGPKDDAEDTPTVGVAAEPVVPGSTSTTDVPQLEPDPKPSAESMIASIEALVAEVESAQAAGTTGDSSVSDAFTPATETSFEPTGDSDAIFEPAQPASDFTADAILEPTPPPAPASQAQEQPALPLEPAALRGTELLEGGLEAAFTIVPASEDVQTSSETELSPESGHKSSADEANAHGADDDSIFESAVSTEPAIIEPDVEAPAEAEAASKPEPAKGKETTAKLEEPKVETPTLEHPTAEAPTVEAPTAETVGEKPEDVQPEPPVAETTVEPSVEQAPEPAVAETPEPVAVHPEPSQFETPEPLEPQAAPAPTVAPEPEPAPVATKPAEPPVRREPVASPSSPGVPPTPVISHARAEEREVRNRIADKRAQLDEMMRQLERR